MSYLNKSEIYLLKSAYKNYLKTNNLSFEVLARNKEEFFCYASATERLASMEYIILLSERIEPPQMDLSQASQFRYGLTPDGLQYAKETFKV